MMKKLCNFLVMILLLTAGTAASAANLPAKSNKYVNDNAQVLNSDELNQLRKDVKAMCDYYPYQIAVCIVPTLNGMEIGDYAAALGQKWNVTNNGDNGLLILVKTKSGNESGQAHLLTSPDLSASLPPSILKKIIQQEMIPHFRNNDYYSGIEAALEYLNNLPQLETTTPATSTTTTNADNYDNTEVPQTQSQRILGGGLLKWILLGAGALILLSLFRKMMNKAKSAVTPKSGTEQRSSTNDNNTSTQNKRPDLGGQRPSRPSGSQPYNPGNTSSDDRGQRPDFGGQRPSRPTESQPYNTGNTYSDDRNQSKEDMIREMEAERRSMSNERTGSNYVTDLNSGLPQDMENELRQYFSGSNGAIDEKTLEEMLKKMATRQGSGTSIIDMAKKAMKVAMSVGAGVVALKLLKNILGRNGGTDEDGGILGKILRGGKSSADDSSIDDSRSTSGGTKPNLGGKKPNLGGGNKEGSSATGSW